MCYQRIEITGYTAKLHVTSLLLTQSSGISGTDNKFLSIFNAFCILQLAKQMQTRIYHIIIKSFRFLQETLMLTSLHIKSI